MGPPCAIAGAATGGLSCCLHPLRMQLEYFDPVCAELGDADAELIAVDLPGHGHSGAPAVDYTASYFTDENVNWRGGVVVAGAAPAAAA